MLNEELPQLINIINTIYAPKQYTNIDIDELRESIYLIIDDFINNKREDSFSSTHSRYLVSRACGNPFLTHLNYVDDITKQAEFLIPKNSNMDSK